MCRLPTLLICMPDVDPGSKTRAAWRNCPSERLGLRAPSTCSSISPVAATVSGVAGRLFAVLPAAACAAHSSTSPFKASLGHEDDPSFSHPAGAGACAETRDIATETPKWLGCIGSPLCVCVCWTVPQPLTFCRPPVKHVACSRVTLDPDCYDVLGGVASRRLQTCARSLQAFTILWRCHRIATTVPEQSMCKRTGSYM